MQTRTIIPTVAGATLASLLPEHPENARGVILQAVAGNTGDTYIGMPAGDVAGGIKLAKGTIYEWPKITLDTRVRSTNAADELVVGVLR